MLIEKAHSRYVRTEQRVIAKWCLNNSLSMEDFRKELQSRKDKINYEPSEFSFYIQAVLLLFGVLGMVTVGIASLYT